MKHIALCTWILFFPILLAAQWDSLALIDVPDLTAWSKLIATSDSTVHWVSQNQGIVSRSEDGGVTWISQVLPGDVGIGTLAYDIEFSDETTGYIVGEVEQQLGTIWETLNGGITWEIVYQEYGLICHAIDFFDDGEIWVSCNDENILKSTDGGESWQKFEVRPTSFQSIDYQEIKVISDSTIVLLYKNGFLFTEDKGLNWRSQYSSFGSQRDEIMMLDDRNGYALSFFSGILKTSDGGNSWNHLNLSSAFFYSMYWLDINTGYVSIEGGRILVTFDGGETWLGQKTDSGSRISAITFFNNSGWATVEGNQVRVLNTSNFGGIGYNLTHEDQGTLYCPNDTLRVFCEHSDIDQLNWYVNDEYYGSNDTLNIVSDSVKYYNVVVELFSNDQVVRDSVSLKPYNVRYQALENITQFDTICYGESIELNFQRAGSYSNYNLEIDGVFTDTTIQASDGELTWMATNLTANTHFRIVEYSRECGYTEQGAHYVEVVAPPLNEMDLSIIDPVICGGETIQIKGENNDTNLSVQFFHEGVPVSGKQIKDQNSTYFKIPNIVHDGYYTALSSKSDGCVRKIKDSIHIEVVNLYSDFLLSTSNILMDEELEIRNLTSDSLESKFYVNNEYYAPNIPSSISFSDTGRITLQAISTSPLGCVISTERNVLVFNKNAVLSEWDLLDIRSQDTKLKIEVDQNENLYVGGGNSLFYPGYENTGSIYFSSTNPGAEDEIPRTSYGLGKYNSDGVKQWLNQIIPKENITTYTVEDFAVNNTDGGLYVSISHVGQVEFTSSDDRNRITKDSIGFVIVQYDKFGSIIKFLQFTAIEQSSYSIYNLFSVRGLDVDKNGNMVIAGTHTTNLDQAEMLFTNTLGEEYPIELGVSNKDDAQDTNFSRYFLMLLSNTEDVLWKKLYDVGRSVNTTQRPNRIMFDNQNSFYIIGERYTGNPFIGRQNVKYDRYISLRKYNLQGELEWENWGELKGTGRRNDQDVFSANHMDIDSSGNVYILCSADDPHYFNDEKKYEHGGTFVAKFSKLGKWEWSRFINTSRVIDLAVDDDKIYARTDKRPYYNSQYYGFPQCLINSDFFDPVSYISVFDTSGYSLGLIKSESFFFSEQRYIGREEQFEVVNGQFYFGGFTSSAPSQIIGNDTFNIERTVLFRYENDIMFPVIHGEKNSRNYSCSVTLCSDEGRELSISPLFKDIEWFIDGELIEGESKSTILPVISGSYSVCATNSFNQTACSKSDLVLHIEAAISPSIIRNGNCLSVSDSLGSYYWYNVDRLNQPDLFGDHQKASSFLPPSEGRYFLRGFKNGFCVNQTDTIDFTPVLCPITDSELDIISGAFCADSVNLEIVLPDNLKCESLVYSWSNGRSEPTTFVDQPGNYSVTISNGQEDCLVRGSIEVDLGAPVSLTCVSDEYNCLGERVSSSRIDISGDVVDYSWSDGTNRGADLPTESGKYGLTVTSINGCQDSCEISILTDFQPLKLDVGSIVHICNDSDIAEIEMQITGGYGNYITTWSTGDTIPVITTSEAGNYSISVSDGMNCSVEKEVVVLNGKFDFNHTDRVFGCIGEILKEGLFDIEPAGSYSYLWTSGDTTLVPSFKNETGLYDLLITNTPTGCKDNYSIEIKEDVDLFEIEFLAYPDTIQTSKFEGQLDLSIFGGVIPFTIEADSTIYEISVNELVLEDLKANTYSLKVSDNRFCLIDTTFTIEGIQEEKSNLTVYPNPSKSSISITIPESDWQTNLSIVILSEGSDVYSKKLNVYTPIVELNISELPLGLYRIVLTNGSDFLKSANFIKIE